ncbi:MAG: hypothetical protein JWM16_6204 [Verrucomicrobiales bacterium]|nr:hypothetical protein [Verrucomicrobiales bacterium]
MAPAVLRNVFSTLAFCAALAAAAPHFPDQSRIRTDYHNGDFDKVIKELEAFQKSGVKCTAVESLFLEKHLAVVYTANPSTRELGRYHMFRMLDLAPGSDLLDMFVGEEVDAGCEQETQEYSLRMASKKNAAPAPARASARGPAAPAVAATSRPKSAAAVPVKAAWERASVPAAVKPTWETASAPVHAKASWETMSLSAPARAYVKPAASKPAWDDFTSAPIGNPASASSPRAVSTASSASDFHSSAGSESGPREFHSGGAPAWKEPGLWIGGGAALAVVALTFFYSNGSDAPAGKTYVVPATTPH